MTIIFIEEFTKPSISISEVEDVTDGLHNDESKSRDWDTWYTQM